ncbi:beta-tectorin-like [Xyrauchen texanus]|uniref:beta-tectorin-like n=1 Tax=Xyrauchen texanus TaxID=154827 RepID=UPI002242505A|nr:beta-tectorin-like [Xyrauchen texanus]
MDTSPLYLTNSSALPAGFPCPSLLSLPGWWTRCHGHERGAWTVHFSTLWTTDSDSTYHLGMVLRSLQRAGLTANPKKCAIVWVEIKINIINSLLNVNRFKEVITNCWATPTPYSTDRKRLTLILNSCSLDSTVNIFENAKDSRSMFQRLEKVSTVWLHCEVQVCDGEKLFCQPTPCSSRRTEVELDPNGGILTMEFQVKAQLSSSFIHLAGPFLCMLSIMILNECLGYFSL